MGGGLGLSRTRLAYIAWLGSVLGCGLELCSEFGLGWYMGLGWGWGTMLAWWGCWALVPGVGAGLMGGDCAVALPTTGVDERAPDSDTLLVADSGCFSMI